MMKKFFVFLLLFVTVFIGGSLLFASLDEPDAITYFERRSELGDDIEDMVFSDEDLAYYYGFDVEDYRQWLESNPMNLTTNDFEDFMEALDSDEIFKEIRTGSSSTERLANIVNYEFMRMVFEEMSDEVKEDATLDTLVGFDESNKYLLGNKSDSYYDDWRERQENRLSENFLDLLSSSERAYYEQNFEENDNFDEGIDEILVYNRDGDYVATFVRAFQTDDFYKGFIVIVRKTADGLQVLKTYYLEGSD